MVTKPKDIQPAADWLCPWQHCFLLTEHPVYITQSMMGTVVTEEGELTTSPKSSSANAEFKILTYNIYNSLILICLNLAFY